MNEITDLVYSKVHIATNATTIIQGVDREELLGRMSEREAFGARAGIIALLEILDIPVRYVSKETGLPIHFTGDEVKAPRGKMN
jgi:hypothetical protein